MHMASQSLPDMVRLQYRFENDLPLLATMMGHLIIDFANGSPRVGRRPGESGPIYSHMQSRARETAKQISLSRSHPSTFDPSLEKLARATFHYLSSG